MRKEGREDFVVISKKKRRKKTQNTNNWQRTICSQLTDPAVDTQACTSTHICPGHITQFDSPSLNCTVHKLLVSQKFMSKSGFFFLPHLFCSSSCSFSSHSSPPAASVLPDTATIFYFLFVHCCPLESFQGAVTPEEDRLYAFQTVVRTSIKKTDMLRSCCCSTWCLEASWSGEL